MLFAIFLATSTAGFAQEVAENSSEVPADNKADSKKELDDKLERVIWGSGRYTRIGYNIAESVDELGPKEKSKFSFSVAKGITYFIPRKPIAGMLKFGIDVKWLDVQITQFKPDNSTSDWTSDITDAVNTGYDGDFLFGEDDSDGGLGNLKLDRMSMTFGMFGVGPYASIAPLAFTGNKYLSPLRVSVYFHYIPTFGIYAYLNDGDFEASYAYVNMMDLGVTLSYRFFGIGVEGHWGSGRFKPLDFQGMVGEDSPVSMGTSRYTRKFASTRLYVQIKF